jgi:bile acid:Na+ symporter, BASS family
MQGSVLKNLVLQAASGQDAPAAPVQSMQGSTLTNVVMPIALGVIMLGLGFSLTPADFRRVFVMPKPVFLGLLCQMVLLPGAAYWIAIAFALPPDLAVGLMLLAASPGGATANVFSHLARGDVALNITLTATNSILSLVSLPLIVGLSLRVFMGTEKEIPLPLEKLGATFAVILVPVAIGMLVRHRKPAFAERMNKPMRTISFVFLLLVITGALIKDGGEVVPFVAQLAPATLLFNVLSFGAGYLIPLAFKLPKRQAIAIGMEIGVHNGTLAIAVATTVLSSTSMAMPAIVYSLIQFGTSTAFALIMARRKKDVEESQAPANAAP